MLSVKRNWLNYISTIAVIVLMTGIAEYCREPEIIFPEIAALAAGALSAPEQIWRVNRSRMFCYIAVCSILGVIVVRYLPFGYWGQMVSAFSAGQMIFLCSKTTFAPMISAAVLPVLLQTDTWIYPVSAVGLTALICILQLISVKAGAHLSESYQPLPAVSADRVKNSCIRILCMAVLSAGVLPLGWKFCVAPPLLVAFTEMSEKSVKPGRSAKIAILITLCAAEGALCRLLIAEKADLPLAAAAFAAAVLFLLAMRTMRLWTPPAGAMAILPMLIGADQILWYPVQVFGGSVVLILAASVFFRRKSPA